MAGPCSDSGPDCGNGDKQIRSGDKVFSFMGLLASSTCSEHGRTIPNYRPYQICSRERRWRHCVAIPNVKGDAVP